MKFVQGNDSIQPALFPVSLAESIPKDHTVRAIVEHPFGTIKRSWGFYHAMTKKGKKKASADVGHIFITFNLKRIRNIMGIAAIKGLQHPVFCH